MTASGRGNSDDMVDEKKGSPRNSGDQALNDSPGTEAREEYAVDPTATPPVEHVHDSCCFQHLRDAMMRSNSSNAIASFRIAGVYRRGGPCNAGMAEQVLKERELLPHVAGLAHCQDLSRVPGRGRAPGHALYPRVAQGHILDQKLPVDATQIHVIYQGATHARGVEPLTGADATVVRLTENAGDAAEVVATDVAVGAPDLGLGLGQGHVGVIEGAGRGVLLVVAPQ